MPTFDQGDIVRVPFPYTDRPVRQYRPALVLSGGPVGEDARLVWVAMITSAENRRWPGDVELIGGHEATGLPAPSVVRTAKIATIETQAAQGIGRLDSARLELALDAIRTVIFPASRRPPPQSSRGR